jgi:predicted nucleotidyltransferase
MTVTSTRALEPGNAEPEETDLDESELLHQAVEIIVREANPEAIVLFGSRARGDARPDSDLDLLVIERQPFGPGRSRIKEAARLYRALGALPASKDLLLYSRDEVDGWRDASNHVAARACREGRLLYGRV